MTARLEPQDLGRLIDPDASAADVPPGEPFDAWRLKALSPGEFAALGPAHGTRLVPLQLAYLAWLHLLAPTTHNTVPQRFVLGEDGELRVCVDRRFILAASDPVGRQASVSLGCGLANCLLGARSLGWEGEVTLEPLPATAVLPFRSDEPPIVEVLRIGFRPEGAPSGESAIPAMIARKIVRAEFDPQVPLDDATAEHLEHLAAGHEGLQIHLMTDAPTLLFLGKFQELADATVLNREAFSSELGAWMLENDSSAFVGMRGAEYGLSDDVTRHVCRGLRGDAALLPDELSAFAKAGNLGIRSASAVAVITADEDSISKRIAVGQAYEEMALALQARGYFTAMHAAITEVDGPNLALRGRLRTRRRPTALFRIGRPLHPDDARRPHASRPPLASLLLGPERGRAEV